MNRYSSEYRLDSIVDGRDNHPFATMIRKSRGVRCSRPPDTNYLNPSTSAVGVIRLYSPSGDQSRLVSLSMETTVDELCDQLKTDSIFLQIGNHHSKSLPKCACPLQVLMDIMESMGYSSISESLSLSSQPFLKHIFAFYLGRPHKKDNEDEMLRAKGWVRKGKMMKRWIRADCLLYHHTIRLSKVGEEDDVIQLNSSHIDRYLTKRGESMRIETPINIYCIIFDDPSSLHSWISSCRKSELTSRCDYSDRGLLLIPDHIFSSKGRSILTHLDLRRNSLLIRADSIGSSAAPLLGWVEDIGRLSLLEQLDLSSNRLGSFPSSLSQLSHLTRLSLAGNQIESLPLHIRLLHNLISLDLSNNWLTDLPSQLSECVHLTTINLSFNRFKKIPSALSQLKGVTTWKLAGNEIIDIDIPSEWLHRVERLDLRRNNLTRTFRLPSTIGDQLKEIDIRDNVDLSTVQLMNVPTLKILRADRLQLTQLQVNGSQLTHLYASHNLLESIVVMPIPDSLHTLDCSHNRLSSLPDWLSDIPLLEYIDASHNLLRKLPVRLFCAPSLRSLLLHRNRLTSLPESIDSPLESIDLHCNRIDYLPPNFFFGIKKLRELNLSGNLLDSLPSSPPSHRLRSLKLSFNNLTESIVPLICAFRSLVILHLAHNRIHFFDDSSLRELRLLEEINLSYNSLGCLSLSIPCLPALRVLRLHSNLLETLPALANSRSLNIVDVSNNHLHRMDPSRYLGSTLRQFDLTCNSLLSLNTPSSIEHRPVTVVKLNQFNMNFSFGFSESAGNKNKLCIKQIRPSLESQSFLFGMIDGGSNSEITNEISKKILSISKEDSIHTSESLSRWILHTHVSLGSIGERLGAKGDRIHVSSTGSIRISILSTTRRSSLSISHLLPSIEIDDEEYSRVRHVCSILDDNNRIDGVTRYPRQIGLSYLFPAVIPSPQSISHQLSIDSQYLIIANDSIWKAIPEETIISIISENSNPHVAAKTIQDAAEAFECTGNASILVIKLSPSPSSASASARSESKGILDESIENDGDSSKLEQIEKRLEKISQVIASIDSPPSLSPSPSVPISPPSVPFSPSSPSVPTSPPSVPFSPPSPSVPTSPPSIPISPPPLPISSPPPSSLNGYSNLSTTSSIYHIGPVGTLRSSLSTIPPSLPSISKLSISTSPLIRGDQPLAHLPSPDRSTRSPIPKPRSSPAPKSSHLSSAPNSPRPSPAHSSSGLPPPDPSRARFHAARNMLQGALRLPPPNGAY